MGIFADKVKLFTTYRAHLQMRGRLMAGIPGDPKAIEGWIAKNAGADEAMFKATWVKSLEEQGVEVNMEMTFDEIREAASRVAGLKNTNVFKKNDQGIYIEGRQVKAMLKENVHILYAGEKWGIKKGYSGKGPKAYLAERAFVVEDIVHLRRNGAILTEPDGVDLQISHTTGPDGPQSSLTYIQFAEMVELEFHVEVMLAGPGAKEPSIDLERWGWIWESAQRNGLGARRSQSFGQFDIVSWDQVPGLPVPVPLRATA